MAVDARGDVYVGDVGEVRWEEVDRVVAGGNYGWPCFEGARRPGPRPAGAPDCTAVRSGAVEHRLPLLTYAHLDFAGSMTLGVFYEGDAYPAAYDGLLFLGDYTMGRIWTHRRRTRRRPGWRTSECRRPSAPASSTPWDPMARSGTPTRPGRIRLLVYDPERTSCPSGTFLSETFRNRLFQPEADGEPWVASCVGAPPTGPDLVAPGSPNQGDGWSMRWTGSPQLAPGTYRLTAKSSGHLEVTVGGAVVPDGGSFTVAGTDLNEGSADVHRRADRTTPTSTTSRSSSTSTGGTSSPAPAVRAPRRR